ncbi:outer membrane lipoprotein carrier protein LolA [Flavobacteriales bacterium]|nr:outer membrane lipoprotein carrier protein LolA [Flavobacteriales bacterium]
MRKLFISLLVSLSTSLFAQDKIAKNILNKLSKTTKSYRNIILDFDFIIDNKSQNIHNKQTGRLELQEQKFRLVIGNKTIINDGESQWIYLSDINEVQIIEAGPEDEMMNPNKLFTIYEKEYKYTYIGTKAKKGKELQIIDLFPEKSSSFIKVTLEVDAAKNQINRISMFDKNGGTYTYEITTFIVNQVNLSPFIFNSSNYPDVEIIDLRSLPN